MSPKKLTLTINMCKKNLKNIADLHRAGLVSVGEIAQLEEVSEHFGVSIPSSLLPLLASAGVARQFVPSADERLQLSQELTDPIGDSKFEKVKGLIHRYPDRCLLKVVNICPVYCRFCFRKEMIGPGHGSLSSEDLDNAFAYIKSNPEIWEVILSGGDPLLLKPARLKEIFHSLKRIPHVEVVRIHTRIPVIEPFRVNAQLIEGLKIPKALYVVVHANHPDEFTREAVDACARIIDAGIPMLSQSVLLKGINDDPQTLGQLMRTFVRNRIKPYYLHQLDLAKGTQHFRVSIQRGQELMKSLQGRFSGLCQPHYMLDIPGGAGKVPIGPGYVQVAQEGYLIEDYSGQLNIYKEDSFSK